MSDVIFSNKKKKFYNLSLMKLENRERKMGGII